MFAESHVMYILAMDLLTDEELDSLKKVWNSADENEVQQRLLSCLGSHDYARDDALAYTFESILMRLCAVYLVETKRKGYALDPVGEWPLFRRCHSGEI